MAAFASNVTLNTSQLTLLSTSSSSLNSSFTLSNSFISGVQSNMSLYNGTFTFSLGSYYESSSTSQFTNATWISANLSAQFTNATVSHDSVSMTWADSTLTWLNSNGYIGTKDKTSFVAVSPTSFQLQNYDFSSYLFMQKLLIVNYFLFFVINISAIDITNGFVTLSGTAANFNQESNINILLCF